MELRSLRLRNFRSILDSGELALRPLTLLVGPNEAGKSSLLHALAMLKQSLESADPATVLVENGRLVQLGAYRQFVYLHETSRLVGFELGIAAPDFGFRISDFGFGDGQNASKSEIRNPKSEIGRVAIEFGYSVRRKSLYLRRFALGDAVGEPWLSVSADHAGKVEHVVAPAPEGPVAIPGTIRRERFLYQIVPAWDRWDGDSAAKGRRAITELAASPAFYYQCATGAAALEGMLRRLAYLGPERASFPVVSQINGNTLPDVGAHGENSAALAHVHRYAHDPPPALMHAASWLERLNVGRHLRLVPIEEHLYEITIEDLQTGLVMNLSEAGRAARQLFPLLLQCSLSEPGATVVLEEPEAHLHPRMQVELADLLAETVRAGRRLLVETYSEPLLRRLQQHIREGALAADDLGCYVAQKVDGITQFTELPIEADGRLRGWPSDFWTGPAEGAPGVREDAP